MAAHRPVGKPFSRAGALALGLGTLACAVLCGPIAAHAATSTSTVHGTVTVAGVAVAGITVGSWAPGSGTLATARTDSHGRFTLHTPSATAVDVWAGSKPSAAAVFRAGNGHLVRGIIGASQPSGIAEPLSQRVARATPARIAGGHDLVFRLQKAGRFTGSSPLLGSFGDTTGEVDIEIGAGNYPKQYPASAAGAFTSGWLVPGRYHLYWAPKPPYLPARSRVTVPSGGTVTATTPDFSAPGARGTTLELHVISGGRPVGADVPVVGIDATGRETSAPSTDSSGLSTRDAVAPGSYTFVVGQYFNDPDEGLDGPPSSDDYVTKTVRVTVAAGEATKAVTVALTPASKVSGTVGVPGGHGASVLVENSAGDVVRRADLSSSGFALGGLAGGTYTVFALDLDAHTYASKTVTLPTASSTSDPATAVGRLTPSRAMLTVKGTVAGGGSRHVSLRATPSHGAYLYAPGSDYSSKGTYSIRTVPGRFAIVVTEAGHVQRVSGLATYAASKTANVTPGPLVGAVAGQFFVNGHTVTVNLEAKSATGDLLEIGSLGSLGRSRASDVAPGTYTWTRTYAPFPALDGPWYYRAPKGSFTVRAGATLDLGRMDLTITD